MPYTSQMLITNAYYLSGIVSRGLETVTNEQLNDGLFRLNSFLAMKSADTGLIPYYQVVNGNFIAGQQQYFFPNLTHVETLAFFLNQPNSGDPVRFPMVEVTRQVQFGAGRVENIQTLPYQWHMERVYGGANVYIYYAPLDNYAFIMSAKFSLMSTVLNQDLSLIYDQFYIDYIMYGLAEYLCEWYQVVPPPFVYKQLQAFENHIRDTSPMDLTMRKMEYFTQHTGIQYADANIGHGFTSIP